MEQVVALNERIRVLRGIAASMQEGAIHTKLFPEIDKILALPDDLSTASVSDREAVARQVREYEQTFDQLGFSLLKQIMPTTGVSPIFRVVWAAEQFKRELRRQVGQRFDVDGESIELDYHHLDVLTRYSLSIGTPPVTEAMEELVGRILLGRDPNELFGFIDILGCDPLGLEQLLRLLQQIVASSLHYCTATEETDFLREAAEFVNFEGGRIFNRVVITESPQRVIELIQDHVFDKFGPGGTPPVHMVEGVDRLDWQLVQRMQAEPNQVFLARITRLPHHLFVQREHEADWRSVIGRLVLIDCSERALKSNTTIVYTLFPHVAGTLRNIQTSLAGRPANTQLQLRRVLEGMSVRSLEAIRRSIERHLDFLERQGVHNASAEEIREREWQRHDLFDLLSLVKLRRLLAFVEVIASGEEAARKQQGRELRDQVGKTWMQYFYRGLPPERYQATVVPGGGRGTLALIGEYHRQQVHEAVDRFRQRHLQTCRVRLTELKQGMQIPSSSTDEIQAAIKQSQLRALSPTQWKDGDDRSSLADHVARSTLYRVADVTSRLARRTREGLERAAFGNFTGNAAAFFKQAFSQAGLAALHGHLEERVGQRVGLYDRRVRDALAPIQTFMQSAQRSIDGLKGELDPIAVSEIETVLELVEQGHFYPALILPSMAWSYSDVFPAKYFPDACIIRVPLNPQHEMDPLALLGHLEELRYLLRRFGELFDLYCQSMLLVINSPHNPTGVVYRRETILRLLKIASEYGVVVVDDNAYHKLVFGWHKAREGDDCVAQICEKYRSHFTRPVRLITAGATTKGLQGSGDRTGLLCANEPGPVEFAERRASAPHQLSLFLSRAKLETGLASKQAIADIERLSGRVLDPTGSTSVHEDVRRMLEEMLSRLREEDFPVVVFETLLKGYEELLRSRQRGASRRHLSECLSRLVDRLKQIRPERRLRSDVEQRVQQVRMALMRALPDCESIDPQGAFYTCVRLCEPDDDRGVQPFLEALSRQRKVDLTYAGNGYVRLSLGGGLRGDAGSYDRLGLVVETYLRILDKYWRRFDRQGRDPALLDQIFGDDQDEPHAALLADLAPLFRVHPQGERRRQGLRVAPSERGIVYCIEEGRSAADKIFVQTAGCHSVDEMLQSRSFRVIYRRLLKTIVRNNPAFNELPYQQLENQYGPLCCLEAYRDRQLIDDDFRRILIQLYRTWHGQNLVKVLAARLDADRHAEKTAALHGLNDTINKLINELMFAFEIQDAEVTATSSFDVGFEMLGGIQPHSDLPKYLQRLVRGSAFFGATAPLDPTPTYVTGATRRRSDYRYGFIRRDSQSPGKASPGLDYFRQRLAHFAEHVDPSHYLCKAVQVGPFRMLLVIHKSCLHLISDELRLFPQIEQVQAKRRLDGLGWDGVLLFGVPVKVMGDSYKTGYILDRTESGAMLPTAWVAREDDTDYFGFLKKSLLTLHNEQVKALGGMPVHGAMITITFVNGLRKTLIFSADSGTGKSETITAMMELAAAGMGVGTELQGIDILAGDMLSLWRGGDGQLYAFGTETGDFLRLTDITENWKRRFGDLLKRGSTSNPDHPKNPRITLPGICDARKVLSPTRVNGFFYINNYEPVGGGAVDLGDDPQQVLKHVLVRGLRKNKGTSGDQPSLRAGLAFAGRGDLVTHYRHTIDELLEWQHRTIEGRQQTCLVYRDGARDVYAAREVVTAAFRGCGLEHDGRRFTVTAIDYDLMQNLFWLVSEDRRRVVLDRQVYDQIYEPLVSTFCGNPFVDPAGMDRILGRFAETMRAAKVHTGQIRTQLARPGHEFSGPERAAEDVLTFLMEDEEVNARYQRNKDKVIQGMQEYYGGVLPAGGNLPIELEGYNLLLLEKYESTHVRFVDGEEQELTIGTPYYQYRSPDAALRGSFVPAIALPAMRTTIADICSNPDHELDLEELEVDLSVYENIRHWNDLDELTYQVLLLNGVIHLGSSETEIARFPIEVRKARKVAQRICRAQNPVVTTEQAAGVS